MKWLKRKLNQYIKNDADIVAESNSIRSDGVAFFIYKANGGFVIELRSYDKKADRNVNSLHIIGDDEDFAARIGQIVYYEMIRY
ncbi:MAG: hypothetical protein N2235_05330 [Fischerella sp.]|nr:hypothetical protein [Fischerella sp.]